VIALLVNPNNPNAERNMRDAAETARVKGVQLHILKAGTESEIDAAFSTLVQLHADALLVSLDGFFISRHEQLVALASRHVVPAIYPWREAVTAGGLISYGNSRTAVARELGIYAGNALALQRAILGPSRLPTGFAVRYEPATRPLEVGGDWYDIVELPDGRIGIMVGDLQRIRLYPAKGFQIHQDIPDDVWRAYEALVEAGYDTHLVAT